MLILSFKEHLLVSKKKEFSFHYIWILLEISMNSLKKKLILILTSYKKLERK